MKMPAPPPLFSRQFDVTSSLEGTAYTYMCPSLTTCTNSGRVPPDCRSLSMALQILRSKQWQQAVLSSTRPPKAAPCGDPVLNIPPLLPQFAPWLLPLLLRMMFSLLWDLKEKEDENCRNKKKNLIFNISLISLFLTYPENKCASLSFLQFHQFMFIYNYLDN